MPSVADILGRAPHEAGVYLMKDAQGSVFYVGKAKDLLARMRQYIHPNQDDRPFVHMLDELLSDVEFFVTSNEKEALMLESLLIRKHRPSCNIDIRDEHYHLSLRLDLRHPFPRLEVVRRRPSEKPSQVLHFGPYASAKNARRMLALVNRFFKLRTCSDTQFKAARRPCLRHQMSRCDAPCCRSVDPEDYAREVRRARLILEGRSDLLTEELTTQMNTAAEALEFETAALLRDQIAAIRASTEKQVVDLLRDVNWDALGYHREGETAVVCIVQVRQGRMGERQTYLLSCRALSDRAMLSEFLTRTYETVDPLPERILLPMALPEEEGLAQFLSERRGGTVEFMVPTREMPRRLVQIAELNAAQVYRERHGEEARRLQALERLARALDLSAPPKVIECVDISNLQGRQAVGSVVCFTDGAPDKSRYRRFRITVQETPDDFEMMREVLTRRLKRGLDEGNLPDLLLLDGGKGQLSAAEAVMRDLGMPPIPLASLAKSRLKEEIGPGQTAESFEGKWRTPERVFRPGRKNPVILKPGTDELNLLMRLRDEAHRFAITYHRQLRSKPMKTSRLTEIAGIGPKRAESLLKAFGSLRALKNAQAEEIAALPGWSRALAEQVTAALREID